STPILVTSSYFPTLLLFFLSSHVPHPHLHSFPTRRSSDLINPVSCTAATPQIAASRVREGGSDSAAGITAASFRHLIRSRVIPRSEEHTSELQSRVDLVCRLLLEKKNKYII